MGLLATIAADIEPYLIAYGVAAIFIVVYLESFGAPLPGETGVIAAGLLASKGDLSIVPLFTAVLAGAVLGDGTGYLIGRFGGRRLIARFGPLVKLTPERFSRIEIAFRDKGPWVVMSARFLPVLRQLNGVIAGTLEMRWPVFLAANAIGALAWTMVWVLGPYFFAETFLAWR
jgi:membrane protein DedA with SNARE-associated domain